MVVDIRLGVLKGVVYLMANCPYIFFFAWFWALLSLESIKLLARRLVLAYRCDCSLERVRVYHINRGLPREILRRLVLVLIILWLGLVLLINLLGLPVAVPEYVYTSSIGKRRG
jgi:hypothetical protein